MVSIVEAPPIRLQSVGWGKGTFARDIIVGDILMWNFGYTNEVLKIEPLGEKFLNFTLKSEDGSIHKRRMKKDRVVARCKKERGSSPLCPVVPKIVESKPIIPHPQKQPAIKLSVVEKNAIRLLAEIAKTCGCNCHSGTECKFAEYIGNNVCIPLLADRMIKQGVI